MGDPQSGPDACWIALETIRSPGNLGTILRTCEAVGAAGLILLRPRGAVIDPHDPDVVRASLGAVLSRRLVRATPSELRGWARRSDCVVVGATPKGSHDYRAVSYRRPVVLMLGDERKGLSPRQQALCDVTVRIPMAGRGDSLNVAVAAGVLLYEVQNQRHPMHKPGKGR